LSQVELAKKEAAECKAFVAGLEAKITSLHDTVWATNFERTSRKVDSIDSSQYVTQRIEREIHDLTVFKHS